MAQTYSLRAESLPTYTLLHSQTPTHNHPLIHTYGHTHEHTHTHTHTTDIVVSSGVILSLIRKTIGEVLIIATPVAWINQHAILVSKNTEEFFQTSIN